MQWIISDTLDKWNTVVPIYDSLDARTFVKDYAEPAIKSINHLVDDGGLGEYQSAPADPALLPRSHNIDFLKNIRNGFKALAWDKAADSFNGATPSSALPCKLEAHRCAIGANIGLMKSWSQARLIEAGALKSNLDKVTTETNPDKEKCKSGIQTCDATLAAIGWGIGCLAQVNKQEIQQTKKTLINDMKAGYQEPNFDPKKLRKVQLTALLANIESCKTLDWMSNKDWIEKHRRNVIRL